MRIAKIWLLFLLLSIISFYKLYASDAGAVQPDYAPNMVKIKLLETALARTTLPQDLKTSVTNFGIEDLDKLMLRIGGKEIYRAHRRVKDRQWERETGFDRWFLVILDGSLDVPTALNLCRKSKHIEFAIPEYYAYTFAVPNDPFYSDNWGHNNTAQLPHYENGSHSGDGVGVVGFDSDAQLAWDKSQGYGSSDVVIAIIDTGVDMSHPDLQTNIWINSNEVPNDNIDNDNDGHIDDINGWDFGMNDSDVTPEVDNPDNPHDAPYHGTACSGIAAAVPDNNIGVAGIAGFCSVMPLKVTDMNGFIYSTPIENAIIYAADHGADVISLSLGSNRQPGENETYDTAIAYAFDNGYGLSIFAATANDDVATITYPSNHQSVIAVGAASPSGERKSATSSDGESWWGSNYGVDSQDNAAAVDIMGPTILPTIDISGALGKTSGDYYMWFNGTSCATPYVAGVAALMLSLNPNLTPAQIRTALVNTATDMTIDGGIGWDRFTGYGLVNANAALNYIILPKPMNLSATPINSNSLNLAWTDNSDRETGFVIERCTGWGQPWCVAGILTANATTYLDANLVANTSYKTFAHTSLVIAKIMVHWYPQN